MANGIATILLGSARLGSARLGSQEYSAVFHLAGLCFKIPYQDTACRRQGVLCPAPGFLRLPEGRWCATEALTAECAGSFADYTLPLLGASAAVQEDKRTKTFLEDLEER